VPRAGSERTVKIDFTKGLVPAIVIDNKTNAVLMLAYMNEEAFNKTLETKETWFYSRSRKTLWNKGETSGNKQIVQSIQLDCDKDTLLIRVDPLGPACHTGKESCFFQTVFDNNQPAIKEAKIQSIYEEIMQEIEDRKTQPIPNSYTNYLLKKGIDKIGKKVIEEAGEIVIAAKNNDRNDIIAECSDLFYHCFVLLAERNVSLAEIERELCQRFAKKGNNKGERRPIKEW
jgi:phosphoribosyl-AMP cyclohydrolase / phosphoribosyl-ATP pyrophosphohydrolase